MQVSVALTHYAVRRLAIDSAPFIYFVEQRANYVAKVRAFLLALRSGQFTALSSALTLTEVLVKPIRDNDFTLATTYRNMLWHGKSFQLVNITPQIASDAAELCGRYNLKAPDAIQVATAIHERCDAFLTNDTIFKRVKEIPILLLDDLEV